MFSKFAEVNRLTVAQTADESIERSGNRRPGRTPARSFSTEFY